ncbi:hypothetical protein GW17_00039165 [Ensete ventricosum]|nr:hypothetical protein GW17_00039165 [Ensete ventricosum]
MDARSSFMLRAVFSSPSSAAFLGKRQGKTESFPPPMRLGSSQEAMGNCLKASSRNDDARAAQNSPRESLNCSLREDLMTVDFDDDVRLAEKEQTILLEPSSKIRLDRTIMPPQDQTPVKNADLELMPMNLKEEDCYVVNHVENLMVVDFDDYVSLAEKEDAGMAERGDLTRGRCSRMDGAEAVAG